MGLKSTTGIFPSFTGRITAEVPTPTYSGTSDPDDASVSINPNTGQGPGPGGTGLTTSQIEAQRAGGPPEVITPSAWSTTNHEPGNAFFTNNNRTVATATDSFGLYFGDFGVSSGKYYIEGDYDFWNGSGGGGPQGDSYTGFGVAKASLTKGSFNNGVPASNSVVNYGGGDSHLFHVGFIVSVALDLDNGAAWLALNNVWRNGATIEEIAAGDTTNAVITGLDGEWFVLASDNGTGARFDWTMQVGQGPMTYTVPTGFIEGWGATS